jgi:Domain of unknown function (DUF6894)
MPPYFFHTNNGEEELDRDGTQLRDVAEARHQALDMLASVLRNGGGAAIWGGPPLRLWVTDGPAETGATLFALTVSASDGD